MIIENVYCRELYKGNDYMVRPWTGLTMPNLQIQDNNNDKTLNNLVNRIVTVSNAPHQQARTPHGKQKRPK